MPMPMATARTRDFGFLGLWLAFILCCTFFGRMVSPLLEGPQNRLRTYALVAAAGLVIAAMALGRLRRLPPRERRTSLAWLTASALALGLLAWAQGNHVESTHVVIFGVLGVLAWRAAGHRLSGWPRLAAALLFCAAVGAGDEIIQHLHPQRYGDLHDVATNTAASWIGCLGCRLSRIA